MSGPFRLTTSKAYETAYTAQKGQSISAFDWVQSSELVIDYYWIVYGVNAQSWRVTGFNCSGRYHGSNGNDDVYYTVIIRDSNNNFIYQSADTKIGVPLEFTLSSTNKQGSEVAYNIQVRLFRLNGARIYNDSLPASSVTLFYSATDNIQENTNPADWYGTGTAAFQNPMETITTVVPSDYEIDEDAIDDSLDIPQRILSAMGFVVGIFTQILSLRYVTFMVCFGLVVGLLGWFLH